MKVVLITGAAPYLGGPETWKPLRREAPDLEFIEVDMLDCDLTDPAAATDALLAPAICIADAVVAHFGVAKTVIEIVARERPGLPVILLSPLLVTRSTVPLLIAGRTIRIPFIARLLATFGRSKLAKLRNDRGYLERQLRLFVSPNAMSAALLDDAQARVRDPRAAAAVEHTANVLSYSLRPIARAANVLATNRIILIGNSRFDRRMSRGTNAKTVPNITGAAMLEAPAAVASELRLLLGRDSVASGET